MCCSNHKPVEFGARAVETVGKCRTGCVRSVLEGVFVYDAGVLHMCAMGTCLQSQTHKPNDKVYYIAYELLMCERTYIQQLSAIVNVGTSAHR